MGARDPVQRLHHLHRTESLSVERNGHSALQPQGHDLRLVGGVLGVHGELEHLLLRRVPRILEVSPLVGEVPEVPVTAEDVARGLVHGHAVGGGVGEGVLAGPDVPLAPRGDHLQVGSEGGVGDLEADLVVALAGGAVREGVRPLLQRGEHLAVGEQRPGERGAEQVVVLVHRAGGEGRVGVVADELLTQVLDDALAGAGGERLAPHRLQVVALAHVAAIGDDLRAAVVLLDPGDDDRGIEPPGVRQHHLLDTTHARNSPFNAEVAEDRRERRDS